MLSCGKAFKILIATLLFVNSSLALVYTSQLVQSSPDQTELPTDWPSIYVYPQTIIADVGETFTISVVIFNLTDNTAPDPANPFIECPLGNLYGFDVQLSWDPTILKYVNYTVTVPVENYSSPIPPSPYAGILHSPIYELMNVIDENGQIPNSNPGTMAWISYSSMPPAPIFNGNGTLFTMTFNVTSLGACALRFVPPEGAEHGGVALSDDNGHYLLFHQFDGDFHTAGAPVANFTFWPDVGVVDKPVVFNASDSYDPDGSIVSYFWDFGDGNVDDTTTPTVQHSYGDAGTYLVSLVVEDSAGVRSSLKLRQVDVVQKRNVKIAEVSLTPAYNVLMNRTVDVEVRVENDGRADENCTVKAYYNASSVNWADFSTTDWTKIGETKVSLPLKSPFSIKHLTWNTTDVPQADAYYYVLANVTSVPYEGAKDNNMTSSDPIFVRSAPLHDVAIEKLEFGWSEAFKSPVLDGEKTTFQITVLNNGTEDETAINIKLYCNDSVLKSWNETLSYGRTVELAWEELLGSGHYNMTTLATVKNDTIPENNLKQETLQVIRTPKLNFTYNPQEPQVNQTISFNASASFHGEPGESITDYKWTIYDPKETLVWTSSGSNLVNISYQFGEEGTWRVILSVKDSCNIKYNPFRSKTSAYQIEARINVQAIGEQGLQGFPIEYVILATVLIVAVVLVVIIFYWRRRTH